MNKIDSIIIHCSATKEGVNFKAKDIDRMHKQRGFNQIGYHYVIDLDGTIEPSRPLNKYGAHCNTKGFSGQSYNKHWTQMVSRQIHEPKRKNRLYIT